MDPGKQNQWRSMGILIRNMDRHTGVVFITRYSTGTVKKDNTFQDRRKSDLSGTKNPDKKEK